MVVHVAEPHGPARHRVRVDRRLRVLDGLQPTQVGPFLRDMIIWFKGNKKDLLQEVVTRGTLKKENLKARVDEAIKQFAGTWSA